MQRIERYGVIALVFLLVTVAAVSFWGDGAGEQREQLDVARVGEQASLTIEPPRSSEVEKTPSASEPPRSAEKVEPEQTEPPLPVGQATDPARAAQAGAARERELQRERDWKRMVPLDKLVESSEQTGASRGRPASHAQSVVDPVDVELVKGRGAAEGRPSRVTVEYVVQPGDTLSGIALETLGSTKRWHDIQALNAGMDPARLRSGQRILLPKGAVFPVRGGATSAPAPTTRAAGGSYVVQAGDVLSRIAARELGNAGRWREIVEMNPGLDPARLLVGTRLEMPAGEARRSAPAVAESARLAAVTPESKQSEYKVR